MAKDIIDVETINILLISEEENIEKAIRIIDATYRQKIVEIIRFKAKSASDDELFDIYQDTIFAIYQVAIERKYEPDSGSFYGFIYKVAINKATDWLRKKFALKRNQDIDNDALINVVTQTIKNSSIKEAWQYAQQKETRTIILEKIRNLIPGLKKRQRQVAEIIEKNFPDVLSNSEVKLQILSVYNEDVTVLAVKRAKQEVYNKIKETLSTTGCGEYI